MNKAMRDYLAKIGKRGGQSTSPAKSQAARDNLQKANAASGKKRSCVLSGKLVSREE